MGGKTRYLAELTAGVNAPVQYMPSGIPERTPGVLEAIALQGDRRIVSRRLSTEQLSGNRYETSDSWIGVPKKVA